MEVEHMQEAGGFWHGFHVVLVPNVDDTITPPEA
jgi:hypothetical protein